MLPRGTKAIGEVTLWIAASSDARSMGRKASTRRIGAVGLIATSASTCSKAAPSQKIHRMDHSGVIDEYVQSSERGPDGVHQTGPVIGGGDVATNDLQAGKLHRHRGEFPPVPTADGDAISAADELGGKGPADAAAATGDENHLVLELHGSRLLCTGTRAQPFIQPIVHRACRRIERDRANAFANATGSGPP